MNRGSVSASSNRSLCAICAAAMLVASMSATAAFAQNAAPISNDPAAQPAAESGSLPGESQAVYSDPFETFNSAMLTFNLKLDDWVLRPAASGYSYVAPEPVRVSVGRFFDNVNFIPRFANNLFQLRFTQAGGEVARFGINSTLGVAGFFDPADKWFGIKQHDDDFGLTLRYYNLKTGPYVMLPFFGPSTVGDTIGLAVDSCMNPVSYFVPLWVAVTVGAGQRVGEAINYRSLHMNQFEEADRYAVDLYGAVQDAYLQTRLQKVKDLKQGS
jgi:phospholipid-binding lipoprotein MlaA